MKHPNPESEKGKEASEPYEEKKEFDHQNLRFYPLYSGKKRMKYLQNRHKQRKESSTAI